MKNVMVLLIIVCSATAYSQGFIAGIDKDNLGVLFGRPATATLASGKEVTGKLSGGTIINGYLDKIVIKQENGEKLKLKPEDVTRLSVKASKLAKLSMMAESTASIKKMTNANFDEITNREYIIFETAMRSNSAEKLRLMQLLNPGFDSKIKVFADPNAKETAGIGIGGIKLTGGEDKSYLFVQNDEKAVRVKKGSYKRNFEEIYQSCSQMLEIFEGEKTKWNDVAGHVFAFDQACQ